MSYPAPIKDGDTWLGMVRFTHKGPAQNIVVSIGLKVAGAPDEGFIWSSTPHSVEDDATEKTYERAVFATAFAKYNLGINDRIDTVCIIQNEAMTETLDLNGSTERFFLQEGGAPEGGFKIKADRYYSQTAGWQDWQTT